MVEAFPLQWPSGWPRSKFSQRAQFGDHSRGSAINAVFDEVRKLKGKRIVISSNLELRLDGTPRAAQRTPVDQGVAVYFDLDGQSQCFPCDRWSTIEHNLWAVAKSIEAIRGLGRWGAKDMVSAAFRGFQALPSPEMVMAMPSSRSWHMVLGVNPDAPEEVRRAAYRVLARKAHPDGGGSRELWDELQRAAKEGGL